jgi:predicted enzyme related to lactoylglutathione lyase
MRIEKHLALISTALGGLAIASPLMLRNTQGVAHTATAASIFAVGPQYDTAHVYVRPEDFNRFVSCFAATFNGTTSKQGVFTVTPTPSSTMSQLIFTPVGTLSVFGFKTPTPYPFGMERTGYLVTNLDQAVQAAQAAGADVIVKPFNDPIGRDAVIQWPGGVNMQLYWHTTPPSYAPLRTIPESRAYVSAERVDALVHSFTTFSHGEVISDQPHARGIEIGRPSETYRRIRVSSKFGILTAIVSDGHLPYPYGHEMTGYEVSNLADTLAKGKAAGVTVLTGPYSSDERNAAMVQFPGGYIAEIHSSKSQHE